MKILLVSDYATIAGGAEVSTAVLRDELRKRGHDARLFASSARVGENAHPADYECFGTTSRFRTLLQTANPWAFRRLRDVLARFRPDVVHVTLFLTQLSPLILPLLRRIPTVYYTVWYRPICPVGTKWLPNGVPCTQHWGVACYRNRCLPMRDWLPLMLQMKSWWALRDVFDCVVADSEAMRAALLAAGIPASEVIVHGVPPVAARGPLSDPPTAGFMGRLVREKGADVLIRAFVKVLERIPQARLILAGEGPEHQALATLCQGLRISERVHMTGRLPHATAAQMLECAWLQAVPSRWAEPFGLAAAEAMMRGTAVVASDAGGLKEIVKNGTTGFLVPPDQVDALAGAMIKLLTNRDLAEAQGRAARELALKEFSVATHADRFLAVYDRIAAGSARREALAVHP